MRGVLSCSQVPLSGNFCCVIWVPRAPFERSVVTGFCRDRSSRGRAGPSGTTPKSRGPFQRDGPCALAQESAQLVPSGPDRNVLSFGSAFRRSVKAARRVGSGPPSSSPSSAGSVGPLSPVMPRMEGPAPEKFRRVSNFYTLIKTAMLTGRNAAATKTPQPEWPVRVSAPAPATSGTRGSVALGSSPPCAPRAPQGLPARLDTAPLRETPHEGSALLQVFTLGGR